MSIYTWIILLSTQITLVIGVLSLLKDTSSKQFRILAIYCFVICIWGFTIFRYMHATDDSSAYLWFKFGFLKFFEPAILLHFVLYFTNTQSFLRKKWKLIFLYIPSISLALLFLLTDSFYVSLEQINGSYTSTGYNLPIASILSILWFLFSHIASILILFRYYLKMDTPMKKRQSLLILIAISLPTVIRMITGMTHSTFNLFLEIDNIAYPISVLIIYFAISKFEYVKLDFSDVIVKVIDNNNQVYVLIDTNGYIVKVNRVIEEFTNDSPNDLVGKQFNSILYYGSKTDGIDYFIDNLNSERIYVSDTFLRSKKNKKFPVNLFFKEIKEVGIVKGYAARFTDISEITSTQDEIKVYEYKLKKEREMRNLSTFIFQELRETDGGSLNHTIEAILMRIRTALELADAYIILGNNVYSDPDVSVTSMIGESSMNNLEKELDELGINYFVINLSESLNARFIGIPRQKDGNLSKENMEYLDSVLYSVGIALEYSFCKNGKE